MEIKIIKDTKVFDDFINKSKYPHYQKTSSYAKMMSKDYDAEYLGFMENDTIIATGLALFSKGIYKYIYMPTGLCIDHDDKAKFKEAMQLLAQYTKSKKVAFLRVDPNIIRVSRDINGNQIDGINNEDITELLKDIGYVHRGYNYAYDGSWHNRYTLITNIDKDMDDILSTYSKQRRTHLNRHKVYKIHTRLGTKDDLDYLMDNEKDLSKIMGFKPHSKDFFLNIIDSFENNCRFYITEFQVDDMINGLEEELNSKKFSKDLKAREKKIEDLNYAKSIKEKYGNYVQLASALSVYTGNTSFNLYIYDRKDLQSLNATDNIHYSAMMDMQKLGVKNYDFVGFSGVVDPSDPYYGLYSFKSSFGSEFIEMIGQFDYIIDTKKYNHFNKYRNFTRRLIRKINRIIFKK